MPKLVQNSESGYTLVELVVVIGIIGILAIYGFTNYIYFSRNQVAVKAAGQIQTYLRQAQTNATTSVLCIGLPPKSWYLVFNSDFKTLYLKCDSTTITNNTIQTYTLTNATFGITGVSCGASPVAYPFSVTYAVGVGSVTVSSCAGSPPWTVTVSNSANPSASQSSFKINNGGAINVQ